MSQVNYRQLGQNGLSFDVDPAELPVGFMTGGENVLPSLKGMVNSPGYTDSGLMTGVLPEYLLAESNNGIKKIHAFGGQSSYLVHGSSPVDTANISGYSIPETWTAVNHKEVVYANNGIDPLQFFNVSSQKFEDVPGFPANTSFQYVAKFKDFVIGLGVIDNGVIFNEEVFWSHPSLIGSTPASWDVTDPAYDAGRQVFPTERGFIYDGLELGDNFYVYKSDSIWALSFVGGNTVFRRNKISSELGILCNGCVVSYPGGHFFVGSSGFYKFTGSSQPEEIGMGRVRDKFFAELDSLNFEKTYVMHKESEQEIWVYYPEREEDYCTKALVWNYKLDSWGIVTVDNTLHSCVSADMSIGSALTWDDMAAVTWEASGRWVEQVNRQYVSVVYEAHYNSGGLQNLFHQDSLGLNKGSIPTWNIERIDFLLGPFSARGNVIQDYETVKIVSELWIRMIANGTFNIYVGGRDNESDSFVWEDPVVYDPSLDEKIDVFISKRFHALRIENIDSTSILLQGINIRWEDGGDF